MDKKYFDSTHRFGRIGALIGIVFMLGIPAVISQVYGVWPESVGSVFMTGSALLAVFIPSNISEVLSFSPVLGSASYIAFLTGEGESADSESSELALADQANSFMRDALTEAEIEYLPTDNFFKLYAKYITIE